MTEVKKYVDVMTPVGRLVKGSPAKGYTKDGDGNEMRYKTGPNAGEIRTDYYLALAVAKDNPEVDAFIKHIKYTCRLQVPQDVDTEGFAFKITDGDSTKPNKKKKKPCDQAGFPGHWIFSFNNDKPPTCYGLDIGSVIPADNIKTGYYIRIAGSMNAHGGTNPGVYLNHDDVELIGYGEEISSRQSGKARFGAAPKGAMPEGVSSTPIASKDSAPSSGSGKKAPPAPPADDVEEMYLVGGDEWTKKDLLASGWTEAKIAKLEKADIPF